MYLEEFPLLLKTSGNLDLFLIQSTQLKNVAKKITTLNRKEDKMVFVPLEGRFSICKISTSKLLSNANNK